MVNPARSIKIEEDISPFHGITLKEQAVEKISQGAC
jgi:hypothetical protein